MKKDQFDAEAFLKADVNKQLDSITANDVVKSIQTLNKLTGEQYYIKAHKGGYVLKKEDGRT